MSVETRTTDPRTGAEKGVKDARFDLIPVSALSELATLYGVGATKYAPRNWERGYDFSKSYAALQRHANQWWGGEDVDEEMGVSHLASVAWHAFAMMTFLDTHPEMDDRPATIARRQREPEDGPSWTDRFDENNDLWSDSLNAIVDRINGVLEGPVPFKLVDVETPHLVNVSPNRSGDDEPIVRPPTFEQLASRLSGTKMRIKDQVTKVHEAFPDEGAPSIARALGQNPNYVRHIIREYRAAQVNTNNEES